MKPFLLLATRAEDLAADGEYAAMLAYGGLSEGQLVRHRLERDRLPELDLAEWSGIIVGGGPFNASDPVSVKSTAQLRAEADLDRLLDTVLAADFPLLGCCYGIGILGRRDGGVVDRTYGEPIGVTRVTLSTAGRDDPLFGQLPSAFDAFVGHKEAVAVLPRGAVMLARSEGCPVQAFRVGRNVYATQFHPELDAEGLVTRIDVYRDHGYFRAGEGDSIKALARAASVTEPPRLLAAFVTRYEQ